MSPRRRSAVSLAWALTFVLALSCGAVFVQGLWRDTRVGEPVIALDLTREGDWQAVPFRIWGGGTYNLFISSVNHHPAFVDARFDGNLDVAIIAPDGRAVLARSFPGAALEHRVPSNYGDTRLDSLALDGWPWHRWVLKARVADPDPRFRTTRTELKLWKDRVDPGMGGMINYVMVVPAGVLLILALFLSLPLATAGRRWPLVLTLAAAALSLAFLLA